MLSMLYAANFQNCPCGMLLGILYKMVNTLDWYPSSLLKTVNKILGRRGRIHIRYSLVRSSMGKTVPEVLTSVSRQSAQFFPIRIDPGW